MFSPLINVSSFLCQSQLSSQLRQENVSDQSLLCKSEFLLLSFPLLKVSPNNPEIRLYNFKQISYNEKIYKQTNICILRNCITDNKFKKIQKYLKYI